MRAGRAVDASSFAHLLRHHRLGRGLTQEELAERARLSARAISDLERGLKRAPRASTVRLLAHALDLSADQAATLHAVAQGGSWDRAHAADESARRDNLPRQLSSFIGRTVELDQLERLLQRTALLTLVGPGGVGKTRLALELAARSVPSAADGVRLVELASLTEAGLVPERVAATLGISDRADGLLLATLTEVLGSRQVLLILDNCEQVVNACAKLAEAVLWRCPRVRMLATSREPLGIGGEQVWPVPPLSLADDAAAPVSEAVQLFTERAAAAVPSFSLVAANRAAVNEICARLDGIPLAIELAAARVKTLTPAQIVARLDDRFQLLVGGTRTAPPRQQTLHATLTWSYELLGFDDRRLFDQLGVFSSGWVLAAAESVCLDQGLAKQDVLNGLERLVDRSLVLAEHGRYRLLETLRQYAHEHLQQTDALAAVRERHANYYLLLAEVAAPELKRADQALWFERLAIEHDNLRAALRWSVDMARPELGLRLSVALARFWEVRGHFSEARRWFAELLGLPDSARQPISVRAPAVAHAGYFAHIQGDDAAARPLLEDSLTLARAADAPATAAFALHGLGQLFLGERDYLSARPLLLESLAVARRLDDGWATARVLSNLGSLAREEGDAEMARTLLDEGLAIARRTGERRIESTLQIALAIVACEAADLLAATSFLEAALATKRALGDRYGEVLAHRTFGWIAVDSRDYVAACHHFLEVLSSAHDLGIVEAEPPELVGLACVAIQLGNPERALRLFAAAARVTGSVGRQADPFLDERGGPLLEAARESVGSRAEALWREGLALGREEVEGEASAVLHAAVLHATWPAAS